MTSHGWDRLRAFAAVQAGWLHPPLPAGPGVCRACRGPAPPEYLHCFHCALHAEGAPGLLADAVVPVSYAVKGGRHAHNLWAYKSALPSAAPAQAALLSLLLVFLRDHGACAWRLAGGAGPTHLAVVPSTRGRPGRHPLEVLAAPCLRLPWVRMALRAGPHPPDPDDRDLSLDRFTVSGPLARARVLLLDDTWTTGARAQSAAAALKMAGARGVALVVLGRHLNGLASRAQPFWSMLTARACRGSHDGLRPCAAGCPAGPATDRAEISATECGAAC